MWNYTKCTDKDREEKLAELTDTFHQAADCLKYLAEVQQYINSTETTIVLLQDLDANVMIEMDYIPVNNYVFYVVSIDAYGIKTKGVSCKKIEQAVLLFTRQAR